MTFDKQSKLTKIVAAVVALLVLVYLGKHFFGKSNAIEIPLPKVIVKKPQVAEMAEYVTQTGTTVSYNSVNLVARVEGYLESVDFIDGTFVKKGKELFVIQPKPYLDQLTAAEATVTAQKADKAYSLSEYARQQRMYKENATSLNNVEKWLAKTQASTAEVDKAEANADIATINYGYTHISAPFDGRIGRHMIDPGNLVGHGEATLLATIDQINPLYVYFNLNEIDLIKLRTAALAKGFKPADIHKIPVYISLQNNSGVKYKGKMNFVNTGLNASTGTMEMRAVLENNDYIFVPGLFVKVSVAITPPTKQLTVPDTALLYDQIGAYLLVVDSDNVVHSKRVETGALEGGMRAIVKGLDANDRVIVSGLQNATPGNKVEIIQSEDGKAVA